VHDVRAQAARRGEVELLLARHAQHQRAALRLHVVADEGEQLVDQPRGSWAAASRDSTRSSR
jgi:hypothetical protein